MTATAERAESGMTVTAEAPADAQASGEAVADVPVRPAATLAVRGGDPSRTLMAKIQYAKALADSGLLPALYRKNPANVLYAVEYGDMLRLPAMAAINGIHVIEGKPSASAGLISALVRRAGHKLRVRGNAKQAVCQIIRSDDPDFTYEVTWTLHANSDDNPSAEAAKLLGKEVWQKYPASMLKSRAITQCARDACEEALYGLHYTPEELGAEVDEEGVVFGEIVPEGAGSAPASADDPWYERTAEGVAWLAEATTRAVTFTSLDDGRKLWDETGRQLRDGAIAKSDADRLADLMKARNAELAAAETGTDVVDAEVVDALDPDDPWAEKVGGLLTAEDCDAALAELQETAYATGMSAAYHHLVRTAIEDRAAILAGEPQP